MSLLVVSCAFAFQCVNVYIVGVSLFYLRDYDNFSWKSPSFLIGLAMFFGGMYINIQSDASLHKLRNAPGERYKIPYGGMFEYISCPNYFGETIEWLGYAVMSFDRGALLFFWWNIANLFPRSLSNHNFNKTQFKNYPKNRKAIIPFVI